MLRTLLRLRALRWLGAWCVLRRTSVLRRSRILLRGGLVRTSRRRLLLALLLLALSLLSGRCVLLRRSLALRLPCRRLFLRLSLLRGRRILRWRSLGRAALRWPATAVALDVDPAYPHLALRIPRPSAVV